MRTVVAIANEPALSSDERRSLRSVVGIVIPASAEYGVPGADDDAIFADILASLAGDAERVVLALRALDQLAGGVFAELPPQTQRELGARLREEQPATATLFAEIAAKSYYRDDRVMRSLGMDPRPPFPLGFEVEPGDWSLLDPVRARPKMYRDVP